MKELIQEILSSNMKDSTKIKLIDLVTKESPTITMINTPHEPSFDTMIPLDTTTHNLI